MGLDMYMWKRKHVSPYDFSGEKPKHAKKLTITIKQEWEEGGSKEEKIEASAPEEGCYIELPFAYWRKANCIHRWILEHTGQEEDVCQRINLDGSLLKQLRHDCLEVVDDLSKAPELLPTQEGCFFGSTEYDEDYLIDIKDTLKILTEDIQDEDEFIYQASW